MRIIKVNYTPIYNINQLIYQSSIGHVDFVNLIFAGKKHPHTVHTSRVVFLASHPSQMDRLIDTTSGDAIFKLPVIASLAASTIL